MKGYLGLGSNVGDRLAHLRAARDSLAAHGVDVLRSSSVYETEPQGEVLDQPDFLNACLEVETDLVLLAMGFTGPVRSRFLTDLAVEFAGEVARRPGPAAVDDDGWHAD